MRGYQDADGYSGDTVYKRQPRSALSNGGDRMKFEIGNIEIELPPKWVCVGILCFLVCAVRVVLFDNLYEYIGLFVSGMAVHLFGDDAEEIE